ncbi:hypothetical protein ACMFMF_003777 [Clarireedia jacksonii]
MRTKGQQVDVIGGLPVGEAALALTSYKSFADALRSRNLNGSLGRWSMMTAAQGFIGTPYRKSLKCFSGWAGIELHGKAGKHESTKARKRESTKSTKSTKSALCPRREKSEDGRMVAWVAWDDTRMDATAKYPSGEAFPRRTL